MNFETERLVLRPWRESDHMALYALAKDPRVGPAAGWAPHKSIFDSLNTIRYILSMDGNFAVTLKATGEVLGASSLREPLGIREATKGDLEIGYWLGVPFWGRGYIPEACTTLIDHAFSVRGADRVWSAFHEGNEKSERVQAKLGFRPVYSDNSQVAIGDIRLTHYRAIDREDWGRRRSRG